MIKEYINYLLHIRGYSENTARAYEKDLKAFAIWVKSNRPGKGWSSITISDVDAYITAQAVKGLKASSTNRQLAAISGIYNYMQRNGHNVINPCKYESRRKRGETVPNTIPAEDLQQAYDNAHGVTKVILGILCTTGIRIQELLDLTWQSINFATGAIKIQGKGNKERVVYTTLDKLDTLQAVSKLPGHDGAERIFTLNQRTVRKMIFAALIPFSNAKQLSPHAIRHSFATQAAAQGCNVATLSKVLGHKHFETTQQYIDLGSTQTQDLCQRGLLIR